MSAGRIRPAGCDDLPGLVALDADLFGVDAWSTGSFAGSLTSTVVGVCHPDLDAYAVLTVAGDVADLQRIGVRRTRRRAGLATALLDVVVGQAREQGAARVLLEVSASNDGALAFYASAGFAEIDRRRTYYRDGTDALVLALDLTTSVAP